MRDTQRSKVYKWERANKLLWDVSKKNMSLEDCQALANKAFDRYGLSHPVVKDGRGRSAACWKPGQNRIDLPLWARSEVVCLHECAHGITDRFYEAHSPGEEFAWHGPEFMRVFLDLLITFLKVGSTELRASARDAKIKVASTAVIKQPSSRAIGQLKKKKDARTQLLADIKKLRTEFELILKPLTDDVKKLDLEIRELSEKVRS